MKNLILLSLLFLSFPLLSQHKVGVRAGVNYSKFNGPLESGESYGMSNGIHFGINYTYEMPNNFGFRAELLYIQRGSKQEYQDQDSMAYLIIDPISPGSLETFVETGRKKLDLNITTGYFSIPLTVQYRVNRRIEVFAGASMDFLLGPSARGKVDFTSKDRPEQIRFIQSLDHSYGSDDAGDYNTFNNENIIILVDGDQVTVPKIIGAYYNFTNEQREMGDRLTSFNAHLIGGVNYFINSGFYLGARYEYGLLDMTNNAVDYSLTELDADGGYIFREDKDTPLSISVSFGFKF